jgi:hypothetical protein
MVLAKDWFHSLVLLVEVSLKGGWFRSRSKELEPKPFGLTLQIRKLA